MKIMPHGDKLELLYEDIDYEEEEKSATKEKTATLKIEERTSLSYEEKELLRLIESRPPISLEDYISVDMNEVCELLGPS